MIKKKVAKRLEVGSLVFVIVSKIHEVGLGKLPNQSLDSIITMLHSPLLLPRNQILPSMIALLNYLQSIMLIHELLIQSKYIGWLSIGYFVCTEPFANSGESARKVLLDVVHVVEEGCPLVFGIDSNNLPISFAFINHAEDTENFDGTDFSCFDNPCANLTDVNGIIVSPASFGVRVDVGGIFPSTWKTSVVEKDISFFELLRVIGVRE